MKRRFSLKICLLICALSFLVLGTLIYALNLPVGKGKALIVFIVPGQSVHDIAETLKQKGLIRNKMFFVWLVRLTGKDSSLKAGEYRLYPSWSTWEIVGRLVAGDVLLHRITIPEGLTRDQIADVLAQKGLVKKEAFLKATEKGDFLRQMNIPAPTAEGYLFPETYTLARGLPAQEIVARMIKQFWTVWASFAPTAKRLNLTVHQVVTLASIVEKEAKVPEERPLIAAVFWNRLRRGMPLQADPTVRYALKKFVGPLARKDLRVESPYNTYLHAGLPPGPICNPGRAAIQAVLFPAKVDYLYFVAKGDGTHFFSRTLKEHLKAIRRFRKKSSLIHPGD